MKLDHRIHVFAVMAFAFLACADLPAANAAKYFVSQLQNGADDSNPGTEAQPWKTIGRAVQAATAGDTVVIGSGTYREGINITRSGTVDQPIRFEAAVAANVIVSGADRITKWQREAGDGSLFSTDWPYSFVNFNPTHAHPGDVRNLLVGRCEAVFSFGFPLHQVLSREKLSRGSFFADLAAKRLYVWTADDADLSKPELAIEASVREVILRVTGAHVQIKGLRFRHCANRAQQGAAEFAGEGSLIEDCVFERNNSSGAGFIGKDIVVRRCIFRENGQMGFGAAHADRLLMSNCEITGNNTKNFDRGWEAGGDKIVLSRGVVIEHSIFSNNRGAGIWFDIGNEDATVRNCLIADNEDAGIFYEISYGLHAHDNVVIGNGFADTTGNWGAAAGIVLSSSPGGVIERNLLVGNKEGFNFREQARTTPRIAAADGAKEEPIWNHDQVIRNNVIAYNRDAQVRGWFDTADERAWPKAMQEKKVGLSLEDLKFTFGSNVYAMQPGQAMFHWGAFWKKNKAYSTPAAVNVDLGLEEESRVAPVLFRNYAARDFRVSTASAVIKFNCYPKGEIPGVVLGIDNAK